MHYHASPNFESQEILKKNTRGMLLRQLRQKKIYVHNNTGMPTFCIKAQYKTIIIVTLLVDGKIVGNFVYNRNYYDHLHIK